jgi:uncharacterized protein (DUF1499 family)
LRLAPHLPKPRFAVTLSPPSLSRICRRCLATAALLTVPLTGCRGTRPDDLGAKDGQLRPCSSRPNCVESREGADEGHKIEAIAAGPDATATFAKLAETIAATERATVVTKTDTYIHAEFASKLFSFVDDAEFLLDAAAGKIHVRSAARLGYRDFNVNRERVEALRAAIAGATAATAPGG